MDLHNFGDDVSLLAIEVSGQSNRVSNNYGLKQVVLALNIKNMTGGIPMRFEESKSGDILITKVMEARIGADVASSF